MTLPDIEMPDTVVRRWRDQRPGHEGEYHTGSREEYEEYQRGLIQAENRKQAGILSRLNAAANKGGKAARKVVGKAEPPADVDLWRAEIVPAFWRHVEAERKRLSKDMDDQGLGYARPAALNEFDVGMAGWLQALKKFNPPMPLTASNLSEFTHYISTIAGKLGDSLLKEAADLRYQQQVRATTQLRAWVDAHHGLPADATMGERDAREARRWADLDKPTPLVIDEPSIMTEPVLEEDRDPALGDRQQYRVTYGVPSGKYEEA